MLTTKLLQNSDYWTLQLVGEIDANAPRSLCFHDVLQNMLNTQVHQLIVDLSAVDVIDAYGFRMLLAAKKEFEPNCIQIILLNPKPHILRLCKIMALDHIFEIR